MQLCAMLNCCRTLKSKTKSKFSSERFPRQKLNSIVVFHVYWVNCKIFIKNKRILDKHFATSKILPRYLYTAYLCLCIVHTCATVWFLILILWKIGKVDQDFIKKNGLLFSYKILFWDLKHDNAVIYIKCPRQSLLFQKLE